MFSDFNHKFIKLRTKKRMKIKLNPKQSKILIIKKKLLCYQKKIL